MTAGAQGYAFLISAGIAVAEPVAVWGAFCMMLASGSSLVAALRINKFCSLWGPFRFSAAPERTPAGHWRSTAIQTVAMWAFFLGIIPAGIVIGETALGWHWPAPHWPGSSAIGFAIFCGCGAVGLRSAWVMAHLGGTPLPSQHCQNLIVTGPYRYIRNPMALSGVGQAVGIGIATESIFVIGYAVLGAWAWNTLVRPLEEDHLLAIFGEQFARYRDQIRCWLPSRAFQADGS